MQLVLFNEYHLGVIQDTRVVDAMAALEGLQFRRPQDLIEEVITRWDALKSRIEAAIRSQEGIPLDSVRLRPPVPKPSKLICAAVNYGSGCGITTSRATTSRPAPWLTPSAS